jgi:hypothetical protein
VVVVVVVAQCPSSSPLVGCYFLPKVIGYCSGKLASWQVASGKSNTGLPEILVPGVHVPGTSGRQVASGKWQVRYRYNVSDLYVAHVAKIENRK